MTDVEALLSVDAGKTPPDVTAFFMGDPDRTARRVKAAFAALAAAGAAVCALKGAGLVPTMLLGLFAGLLGILATPTVRLDNRPPVKRPVMVVTARGLIVRDAFGLRSWSLDDLADVIPGIYDSRPYLDVIERNGARHTIETLGFRRVDRVREAINRRLRLRQAQTG